jgi:selenocysteine lyase/cysteine desulfurase
MNILPTALGDRSLFSTLQYSAYLNYAGIAPPSAAVASAVNDIVDRYAREGFAAWNKGNDQRTVLRQRIATMLHTDAANIALVPNTTHGVIDIAQCFPFEPGDQILLFSGEFPANVTPWQQAAARFGLRTVSLSLAPFERSHQEGLEAVETLLRETAVRLIAVSAVQFQTGFRMPFEALTTLAHRYNAQLFVDAVQACPIVPIDLRHTPIDYLACGAHKWMMGLEGAGFLYVAPARIEALRPSIAGWLSHENPVSFLFEGAGHLRADRPIRKRADFVEVGNLATASFTALDAALACTESLGYSQVFQHIQRYLAQLEPALVDRGFVSARSSFVQGHSGSLSLRPPEGVSLVALHRQLVAEKIGCAMPDGWLRFSPHWPNSLDEIPVVLAAVDRALKTVSSR